MDLAIRDVLLSHIAAQWRTLRPLRSTPDHHPPWGVWIQQYAPITADEDPSSVSFEWVKLRLRAVWFLDDRGMQPHQPSEYLRFIAVLRIQPWCTLVPKLPSRVYGVPYHQIGQAAFAEYDDNPDIYLHVIWGGRFGCGWRVHADQVE